MRAEFAAQLRSAERKRIRMTTMTPGFARKRFANREGGGQAQLLRVLILESKSQMVSQRMHRESLLRPLAAERRGRTAISVCPAQPAFPSSDAIFHILQSSAKERQGRADHATSTARLEQGRERFEVKLETKVD